MSIFLEGKDSPEEEDWTKPSLAVVACDGNGHGVVLWTAGPHIDSLISDAGVCNLADLGLDDAPVGISIWEGVVRGSRHETMDGTEYETHTEGTFRAATADEWASIKKDECPWDPTLWLLKKDGP